ncbi:hypothetical protein Smp_128900 [Schistosoma mansoni]|uniref:hypothetical protein n=1 Tax=Schistosoma mansoni TaxID=6183 RepID=UPI0001A632AE|nr:hypothetical protein Smp_128900 [Schistosoma mansoni]|eukprot:XP_018648133.1 hypothetical protein Smp_128900 [Schistosoma mansoni]
MERPDNVGDRKDQPNSNGNEEIQLGSTRNQRNPLDTNWTTKARYRRDAAVFRSRRGKCSTHSGSCSNAVQRSTKCTCGMGISWTQDNQSIIQNKEGGDHNECYPMLCTHKR